MLKGAAGHHAHGYSQCCRPLKRMAGTGSHGRSSFGTQALSFSNPAFAAGQQTLVLTIFIIRPVILGYAAVAAPLLLL